MNKQLSDKIRNDPETRRRLTPALIPWLRPRDVLSRLNTWSPKYWSLYWYWYGYGHWTADIPEEYVNRLLEGKDLRI